MYGGWYLIYFASAFSRWIRYVSFVPCGARPRAEFGVRFTVVPFAADGALGGNQSTWGADHQDVQSPILL